MSDDDDMGLSEALTLVRSGGRFWRAWARTEKAASVIEAHAALEQQREQRIAELERQAESVEAQLADKHDELAAVQLEVSAATARAGEILEAARVQAGGIGTSAQERHASVLEDLAAAQQELSSALSAKSAALAEEQAAYARIEAAMKAARASLG